MTNHTKKTHRIRDRDIVEFLLSGPGLNSKYDARFPTILFVLLSNFRDFPFFEGEGVYEWE